LRIVYIMRQREKSGSASGLLGEIIGQVTVRLGARVEH
jgi:hypothetical protein